jgi:hypothetical protein
MWNHPIVALDEFGARMWEPSGRIGTSNIVASFLKNLCRLDNGEAMSIKPRDDSWHGWEDEEARCKREAVARRNREAAAQHWEVVRLMTRRVRKSRVGGA